MVDLFSLSSRWYHGLPVLFKFEKLARVVFNLLILLSILLCSLDLIPMSRFC